MNLQIVEIIGYGQSDVQETIWLKCKTASGKIVAFWGEYGMPNRNIASIRYQKMPVFLEILNVEV